MTDISNSWEQVVDRITAGKRAALTFEALLLPTRPSFFLHQNALCWQKGIWHLNIAKGTTDPRVEFISQVQTQILIKFHFQNLDQASTSKSQPNIHKT